MEEKDLKSTAEKLVAAALEREQNANLGLEEMAQFKQCVNRLFSTSDGKYFWKTTRKIMKIGGVDYNFNPIMMAQQKAYQNYYNSVMKLLEPELRAGLSADD